MAISKRLEAFLALLRPKKSLWDVCCDHGDLGIAAARRNLAQEVFLVDQVPSIIEKLNEKMRLARVDVPVVKISALCEDATKKKRHFENANIVLAGVGENTAIKILENYSFENDCEILLAIHSENYALRSYLRQRKFGLLEERVLKDKGKLYEIIKASPSRAEDFNGECDEITDIGSKMWERPNSCSRELLKRKIERLEIKLAHSKDEIDLQRLEGLRRTAERIMSPGFDGEYQTKPQGVLGKSR